MWRLETDQGYEERVFEAEGGGDGKYGVEAAKQRSEQDELSDVRFHGEASQVEPQRRQVLRMVQGVLTHTRRLDFGEVLIGFRMRSYTFFKRDIWFFFSTFKTVPHCYPAHILLLGQNWALL